jgi:hypothetical protein
MKPADAWTSNRHQKRVDFGNQHKSLANRSRQKSQQRGFVSISEIARRILDRIERARR